MSSMVGGVAVLDLRPFADVDFPLGALFALVSALALPVGVRLAGA